MAWRLCKVPALALPLFIAYIVHKLRADYGDDKLLDFNDDRCMHLEAPYPMEDLSAVGDGHCVIGGGADALKAMDYGPEAARDGGIYLINATQGTIRKLSVIDSEPPKLIVSGVFYSQISRRVYAVNYAKPHGDSVEVFQVVDMQTFDLRHIASVQSELFQNWTLNDVVEGASEDEFYVSQWTPFGLPKGGFKDPKISLWDRLPLMLIMPIHIFRIKATTVFRCTYGGGAPQCGVGTPHRFVNANGMSVSADRQTVYVSDPGVAVVTLRRQASGQLEYVSEFKTIEGVDNLEVGPDGRIHGGAIPLAWCFPMSCEGGVFKGGRESEVTMSGRRVGCGRCPGSMIEMSVDGTAQAVLLTHDGSKLDSSTAALKLGDHAVLAGPATGGAMVCKL